MTGHVSLAVVGGVLAASATLRGGTDISIHSVREVASSAAATTHEEFYVVDFSLTNRGGVAIDPQFNQFVVQDALNRRFPGVVSGDPALVGIRFDASPLAPGASRAFTIGFRVPDDTIGTLFYDSTR